MKKRFLALALVSAMVFSMTACSPKENTTTPTAEPKQTEDANKGADATEEPTENPEDTKPVVENLTPSGQVVIGTSTMTEGDITPFWSNGASDYDVFKMVSYGCSPVELTKEEEYIYNDMVTEDWEETDNEDGSKTYRIKLKPDLKWSNGEQITAKDYVFALLFLSSNELITDLQAVEAVVQGQYIKGFEDYSSGKTDVLEGVHLISDDEYSITIDAKNIPNYYGKFFAWLEAPLYMKAWVPEDITIEETEKGAKFSDNYTADYIKASVEKERWNPTVFCGAYTMEKYDKGSYSYVLKANPLFKGNYEGKKANIETIVYKYVTQDTMMDEIKTGAIDLLLQCADGAEINAGLDMADAGTHGYLSYPRNGYGQLIFKCDIGPTQFVEVRQAVAYLLDRNDFTKTFTDGHGSVVNGPYGLSQWMVEEAEDELATLNSYNYSLDEAVKVLEAGGWTKDKAGKDYSGTGIRYKEVDGKFMPLTIQWCSSENNSVSDLLVTKLVENPDVKKAGINIVQNVVTFDVLLDGYYTGKGNYNMFNMGEGFSVPYDVKDKFAIGGSQNHNKIADEELATLAEAMNRVPEGDDEQYLSTWFGFMKRWNELLPNVPLYSNEYHDFYTKRLVGYEGKTELWDTAKVILYARIEDVKK